MRNWIGLLLIGFGLNLSVTAQDNIVLLSPHNGDTIHTKHPILLWSYLGNPAPNNDRDFYRLILVKLNKGQSPEAGIMVNQPMIKMDRIPGSQLFYPYDAPELEDGKRYGWQIQRITNGVLADKSEAFEFILPLPEPPLAQYYRMKFKPDGAIWNTFNGRFCFTLDNPYQENQLKYLVYDSQNQLVNTVLHLDDQQKELSVPIKKVGTNYYEIAFSGSLPPGIYRIVVMDPKKQRYEAKFRIN
jgi:hypothetical protein